MKIHILGNGLLATATAAAVVSTDNSVVITSRSAKASDLALAQQGVEFFRSESETFWSDTQIVAGNSEVVVSAVGVASPASVESQPDEFFNETREIVENLEEMVNANPGLRLYVVTSGGTVYGETPLAGAAEDFPKSPVSHYGILNSYIEDSLLSSPAGAEGRVCCLHVANPYGVSRTGFQSRSFVDAALTAGLSGDPLTIFGDGRQVRDFIHIDDVATLIAGCVESLEALPSALNIGTGIGYSLNEVTDMIERCTGRLVAIHHEVRRPFDVQVNVLDSRNAISIGGHLPRLLEEGLGG